MQIWVDADACPKVIKEILFRAAERARVPLVLVANRRLYTPPSEYVQSVQVPQGSDVADHRIADAVEPGDLVVTTDIPLAAIVIAKGAHALDPRGELYTGDNIGSRLAMRNLMSDLRGEGVLTGGPVSIRPRDRKAFADELDRFLGRRVRGPGGS